MVGRDEKKEWAEMLEAMAHLGIGPAEQKQIFDVTAAVLHLGRVQFASDKSQAAEFGDNEAKIVDASPMQVHGHPGCLHGARAGSAPTSA